MRRGMWAKTVWCAALVIALGGCGRTDVSSDPKYQGGFVPGTTYRLLADAQFYEDPKGAFVTKAGYNWNGSFGAPVPKGVRLQVDRIEREPSLEAGHLIHFTGHFVDGPFAGRSISLNGLTIFTADGPQRSPEILEPVP
jgi:hypothetical protein